MKAKNVNDPDIREEELKEEKIEVKVEEYSKFFNYRPYRPWEIDSVGSVYSSLWWVVRTRDG